MNEIKSILEGVPEKDSKWKDTTSRKWKEDVLNYFSDINLETVLEIGTNQGWTSYVLSFLAKNVYTVEYNLENIEAAKRHCASRSNITFIQGDAYNKHTYSKVPSSVDVVVIDCIHTYSAVIEDIKRALSWKKEGKPLYLVFDDYSHPNSTGVRLAVEEFLENSVEDVTYIGEGEGFKVNRSNGTYFTLTGPEGLIIKI